MHDSLLATSEGNRIRCGLCPHACAIAEDATGRCGARGVVDGVLRALTYGIVSSAADDPIEKKPVFHYHPGTTVFSVGSLGCTMRCGHCQNWHISRPCGDDGTVPTRFASPEAIVEMALAAGSSGVAFTYNEPVIWLEYVLDVAALAHEAGLYTVMVTNGYVTLPGLDLFAAHIDVWRVDVKAFSDESFRSLCHVGHAEAVREAAQRARRVHAMHVECVTNVVPGVNDSDGELRAIAEWIATELGPDTPWHVTRFIPYLEFADCEPTPLETLVRAREIGTDAGLAFVYLGNVLASGAQDTLCPNCGARVVERTGYSVIAANLSAAGACAACGYGLNMHVDGRASD